MQIVCGNNLAIRLNVDIIHWQHIFKIGRLGHNLRSVNSGFKSFASLEFYLFIHFHNK